MLQKSTKEEIKEVEDLVLSTRAQITDFIQDGKKVHVIWDFDGVLVDSRSDDVFALMGYDLEAYFAHEERLLFQTPGYGPWCIPIANNGGRHPHFQQKCFTQDIVTARSSNLAIRVHMFCLSLELTMRWMLFLGHQSKSSAYRIILDSLKEDPDCVVFCIDDGAKHIEVFQRVAKEAGMEERTFGIVSPVIRTYTHDELKEFLDRVMGVSDTVPIRVRDPSNDMSGFIVLPGGFEQFRSHMNTFVGEIHSDGNYFELRRVFERVHGKVGKGTFNTEEELERAIKEFILGFHI